MQTTDGQELFLRQNNGAHTATITQIVAAADGSFFITAGEDQRLRWWWPEVVWDDDDGEPTSIDGNLGHGNDGDIDAIALSPDDRFLLAAVSGPDRTGPGNQRSVVRVIELHLDREPTMARAMVWDEPVVDLAFDKRNRLFVATTNRLEVQFEMEQPDPGKGPEPLAVTELADEPVGIAVRTAGDQTLVFAAFAESNPRAFVFDGYELSEEEFFETDESLLGGGNSIAASDDLVAVAGMTSADGQQMVRLFGPDGSILEDLVPSPVPCGVAFSADGQTLVVGSASGTESVVVAYDTSDDDFGYLASRRFDHDATAVGILSESHDLDEDAAISAGGTEHTTLLWPLTDLDEEDLDYAGWVSMIGSIGICGTQIAFSGPGDTVNRLSRRLELDPCGIVDRRDRELRLPMSAFSRGKIHVGRGQTQHQSQRSATADGHTLLLETSGDLIWETSGTRLIGHADEVVALAADGDWLVTAGRDLTIRLWFIPGIEKSRGGTLGPALNLFVTDDDDWVIWSASGLYESSPDGDEYVDLHLNNGDHQLAELFPVELFQKQLRRPLVISDIVRLGSEHRAIEARGIDPEDLKIGLPPIVEPFGPPSETGADLRVTFRVQDRGNTPTTRIWVTNNGIPVWEKSAEAETLDGHYEPTIPLEDGVNEIAILAENRFGISVPMVSLYSGSETGHGDELTLQFLNPESVEPVTLVASNNGVELWREEALGDPGAEQVLMFPLHPGPNNLAVHAEINGERQDRPLKSATVTLDDPADDGQTNEAGSGTRRSVRTAPYTPVEPNLYYLAVGVSKLRDNNDNSDDNQNRPEDLQFSANDATAIAAKLEETKGAVFNEVHGVTLTDDQATNAAIREAFANLKQIVDQRVEEKTAQRQRARDVAIVFFSGHGATRETDHQNDFYLVTHDWDSRRAQDTGIMFKEIGAALTTLMTVESVVMIDACYSGVAGLDSSEVKKVKGQTQWVLSASRPDEVSQEAKMLVPYGRVRKGTKQVSTGHGYFTHAILSQLQNAAATGEEVKVKHLVARVEDQMDAWRKRKGKGWEDLQHPQAYLQGGGEGLVIYKSKS